jgi:PAS domain S-box-containing protein
MMFESKKGTRLHIQEGSAGTTLNYRLLVVDDDQQSVDLVRDFLNVYGARAVDWAPNIREIWPFLKANQYDLILLDYRLPDGTGLEALSEIRQLGYQLPVLMVTGQGDERVAVRAMQLGAADYLVKGGGDYPLKLPALIQKAVQAHRLQLSVQHSLDQIRYQALLLNNVRDAVVVWDIDGKITYHSPAAEILFDLKSDDCLQRPVDECYLYIFDPPVRIPPPESTAGQEIERRYSRKDGRTRWISSRVTALRDYGQGGRLIGYMDVSRDITGRKQAENDLRERFNLEKSIAAISTDFINLPSEAIDQGIHQALETVGSSVKAERSYVVLFSDDGACLNNTHEWCAAGVEPRIQGLQKIPVGEAPWNIARLRRFETVNVPCAAGLPAEAESGERASRSPMLASHIAIPMVYKGALVGFLGFDAIKSERAWDEDPISLLKTVGDIILNALKRKQMEAQIRAAQTRLAQSARLAAIGELASGVAHHINNPLTAIIAEAQLLQAHLNQDSEGKVSAEIIEKAGWRVQEAVQRLLDFSRPPSANLENLDVNETIRTALALVGDHVQASGVSLQVDLAKEPLALRGNARQLRDLWVNLLLLARDATSDGLPHVIALRSQQDAAGVITVEVRDDGNLISPDEIGAIFEPNFFKSVGGRGNGIELSICHEIVRQHQGRIAAESDPERGTIFRAQFGESV